MLSFPLLRAHVLLGLLFLLPNLVENTAATSPGSDPIVKLNYGAFQGSVVGNVESFLGMPFAAPPVGNLRFAPPHPPVAFRGVHQATTFGAACFQQAANASVFPGSLVPTIAGLISTGAPNPSVISEDCLFINVVRPVGTQPGKKLPVVFWIYGGGFQNGDTSLYPGSNIVSRSIALNEPVVYVSANYRLSALGWLASKEVQAAGLGNIGLRDQRFALKWVQKYITAFGGDPRRVTIWGESAGALSVGTHLIINDGNPEGLFHAAVMQSGSPYLMLDIADKQPIFDQLVANSGCTGSPDPIACMRAVPFDQFSTAMNLSPNLFSFSSLSLAWQPTIDGDLIKRDPQISLQKGLYAKVPILSGDCDDEGTFFSFANANITTNEDFLSYMQSNYFRGILSDEQLAAVGEAYPDDVTQGSPFDTGTANALTPQYKRLAAIQGDWSFQAPRRFLLETTSKTQPTFAFLYKRNKTSTALGSFHGTDIPEFYGAGPSPDLVGADAIINFANTGNPSLPKNPKSLLSSVNWKQWGSSKTNPPMLTFTDPIPSIAITSDTFRLQQMALLTQISLQIANTSAQP
ncbi:Lipase 1 [Psilocybe cubensis]|uniref:Lipase 1 n=2 Tax=Psilocybe cubensis TaxID=181762 RepID=A0ACB8GJM2_PSICU|nr:Lipase 1 [Psilocybe cubensis]KAH9475726.1 Lipase 1 [Psilocybe cubensis]